MAHNEWRGRFCGDESHACGKKRLFGNCRGNVCRMPCGGFYQAVNHRHATIHLNTLQEIDFSASRCGKRSFAFTGSPEDPPISTHAEYIEEYKNMDSIYGLFME